MLSAFTRPFQNRLLRVICLETFKSISEFTFATYGDSSFTNAWIRHFERVIFISFSSSQQWQFCCAISTLPSTYISHPLRNIDISIPSLFKSVQISKGGVLFNSTALLRQLLEDDDQSQDEMGVQTT